MGQKVSLKHAAAITGRHPMTIRAAIRSGELRATKGNLRGGSKGKPAHMWDIDPDDLRPWHVARGGKTWHVELIPPDARLEAMSALLDTLCLRVAKLERWRRKARRARAKH